MMRQVETNLLLAFDDEFDFLDLIETVATEVGFQVLTARTSAEFFDQLTRRRPSLVVFDLQLPGMDSPTSGSTSPGAATGCPLKVCRLRCAWRPCRQTSTSRRSC